MARSAAQVEAELQRLEVENENDSTSSNSLDYIDDSEVSVPYEDDASAMMNGDDAVLQRLEQQRRRELALLEQERQRLEQQLHPAAEEEITGDYTIGIVSSGSRKRKSREEDILEDIEMKMTEEEQRWARELKSAILQGDQEDDTPLRQIVAQNRITDMELAQHAIVSNGDIEESLKRIVHLDQHRKQYGINDTVAQGVESIQLLMQQHPGYLLSVDQCARHHYYVHVVDFAKFRPKEVQLPHDWKIFLRGMYYLQQCFNPTLAAVRNGILAIAECDGMGWDNFCLDFERRVWYEHCGSYPFKFHEISWVRPPLVANVAYGLLKPILPDRVKRVFHLGVKFDDDYEGRLDELFLQPTKEVANLKMVQTAETFLTRRYRCQASFKLR